MSLELDVRDLIQQPGSSRAVRVEEPVPGLATEMAEVPHDSPVAGELLMESVVEGVLVSGSLSGEMTLSCARCLRSFRTPFREDMQELFYCRSSGDDEYAVVEGVLDLQPMVRDVVVLAMPFSPLCRPDCLGLCERCGGDRNLGECVCPAQAVDPRWGALSALEFPEERRASAEPHQS